MKTQGPDGWPDASASGGEARPLSEPEEDPYAALPPPPSWAWADPPQRPNRRRGWTITIGLLVLLGGCGAYVVANAEDILFGGFSKDEGLEWAGFYDLHGARISAYDSSCGMDCNVSFLLEGSPAEVDAALASAAFDELERPEKPMSSYFAGTYPPAGIDPAPLMRPMIGESTRINDGSRVYRGVVRSELPDGRVQLVVFAYST